MSEPAGPGSTAGSDRPREEAPTASTSPDGGGSGKGPPGGFGVGSQAAQAEVWGEGEVGEVLPDLGMFADEEEGLEEGQ